MVVVVVVVMVVLVVVGVARLHTAEFRCGESTPCDSMRQENAVIINQLREVQKENAAPAKYAMPVYHRH